MARVQILRIVGLPTWQSQEKRHLGVALVASHTKDGGSPKFGPW